MGKFQRSTVLIQFTMAVCGGFLGAYALFSRQMVFGSSQTANVIELVSAICGRNLPEMLKMCIRDRSDTSADRAFHPHS